MLRRSAVLFAVVGCIAAIAVAGCGSKSSSSSSPAPAPAPGQSSSASTPASTPSTTPTTSFAKTKFVLHFGLAVGAFHRWIYKPFKAGSFARPTTHKLALVKAAAAALFVYHELKLAYRDAQSSPLLRTLTSPITALMNKFQAMRAQFQAGKYNPADINSAQATGNSIGNASAAKGAPISDLSGAVPNPSGAGAPTG
jgi:hypothetical protein